MSEIKTFKFDTSDIDSIRAYKYGSDWPIVYILENGKEMYVGETFRAYSRAKQHLENPQRKKLNKLHLISDDEANKSATLDVESSLIEYFVADGKFVLQNGNGGLQNHNYYDRERYRAKFEVLWEKLRSMNLATKDLRQIRNSDLFKYSPYKTLTDDQYFVANKIIEGITSSENVNFVIQGGPGTGKSIVATYLIKQLVDKGIDNVALVIAMTPLRNTLKKVFRSIPGLSASMVVGPSDVARGSYDVVIVDETHRLRQRRNIPNYGTFDETNRQLGFDQNADELDWILHSTSKVVLFYDPKQSVRPSDISPEKILNLEAHRLSLSTQMRVKGGEEYLAFIDQLLEESSTGKYKPESYDFKVFSDFNDFILAIKNKDKEHSLSRMVAGYAWDWLSKTNPRQPDIVIEGQSLFWNSRLTDWVNSPNAVNEVGCIHTIQGYDLNYAGVIMGPEISYNPETKRIEIDKSKYKDANGHRGVSDENELKRYIINIYKTLLTRGILGTYIYVCDSNLRDYLKRHIEITAPSSQKELSTTKGSNETLKQTLHSILSPYAEKIVSLPLYDSVGCGDMMYADPVSQETMEIPESFIRSGAKYFILRTSGDSMNELGIEDGDLILCQKNYQAPTGSIAIVLIGDEAVLKEIKYEEDGLLLKPRSTNPQHKVRKLGEDDDFKVLGIFVKKLN
jgi:uncharacterized protein